jgi:hypothetical protein
MFAASITGRPQSLYTLIAKLSTFFELPSSGRFAAAGSGAGSELMWVIGSLVELFRATMPSMVWDQLIQSNLRWSSADNKG